MTTQKRNEIVNKFLEVLDREICTLRSARDYLASSLTLNPDAVDGYQWEVHEWNLINTGERLNKGLHKWFTNNEDVFLALTGKPGTYWDILAMVKEKRITPQILAVELNALRGEFPELAENLQSMLRESQNV